MQSTDSFARRFVIEQNHSPKLFVRIRRSRRLFAHRMRPGVRREKSDGLGRAFALARGSGVSARAVSSAARTHVSRVRRHARTRIYNITYVKPRAFDSRLVRDLFPSEHNAAFVRGPSPPPHSVSHPSPRRPGATQDTPPPLKTSRLPFPLARRRVPTPGPD